MKQGTCRICGNTQNLDFIKVKERMLGTLDEFTYFQCPECGCLQIEDTPDNLADYYPDNYYSYKSLDRLINAPLRRWVDSRRVSHLTVKKSLTGFILDKTFKSLEYIPWIQNTSVELNAKILDVGCGQGRLLLRMALGGFTNLTGIDPFIKEDVTYSNNVKLLKSDLATHASKDKQYDLIMLHHSLEHMPDQQIILRSINKLLTAQGTVIIRIPLADSYAWQNYKENWVQLDAPRHLYLHSKKSFEAIANDAELKIVKTVYDSGKFQFTGSELYKKGISLSSSKKQKNIFNKQELAEYAKKAIQLNISEKGDQAVFYLKNINNNQP